MWNLDSISHSFLWTYATLVLYRPKVIWYPTLITYHKPLWNCSPWSQDESYSFVDRLVNIDLPGRPTPADGRVLFGNWFDHGPVAVTAHLDPSRHPVVARHPREVHQSYVDPLAFLCLQSPRMLWGPASRVVNFGIRQEVTWIRSHFQSLSCGTGNFWLGGD